MSGFESPPRFGRQFFEPREVSATHLNQGIARHDRSTIDGSANDAQRAYSDSVPKRNSRQDDTSRADDDMLFEEDRRPRSPGQVVRYDASGERAVSIVIAVAMHCNSRRERAEVGEVNSSVAR